MIKTFLLFPPQWSPFMPYLSTPSLQAYLKGKGKHCQQDDLNVRFYDYILKPEIVEALSEVINAKISQYESRGILNTKDQKDYLNLLASTICINDVKGKINEAKETLKSPEFYQGDKYISNYLLLDTFFAIYSSVYVKFKINFSNMPLLYAESIGELMLLSEEGSYEPLRNFYKEYAIERLKEVNPNIVGISVVCDSQLIPAIILCKMIKNLFPSVYIIVGGPYLAKLEHVLLKNKEYFNWFDAIALREGEHTLLKAVELLESHNNINWEEVPGILYCEDGNVNRTKEAPAIDINELPTPDFTDIPFNLYITPEPIVPLLGSRGCYWNKCSFCDLNYIHNKYSKRNKSLLYSDIKTIQLQHNVKHFAFVDESIAPITVKYLAQMDDIDIKWYSMARAEEAFSEEEYLDYLKKSGCVFLMFGIESGSPRVAGLINKGIDLKTIGNVLAKVSKTGIWTHGFFFLGFPTETNDEINDTFEFINKNSLSIDSIGFGTFKLGFKAPIADDIDKYGIISIKYPNNLISHWYEYNSNCKRNDVHLDNCINSYKKRNRSYDRFINREHLFLYNSYLYDKEDIKSVCAKLSMPLSKRKICNSCYNLKKIRYNIHKSDNLIVTKENIITKQFITINKYYNSIDFVIGIDHE